MAHFKAYSIDVSDIDVYINLSINNYLGLLHFFFNFFVYEIHLNNIML